MSPPTFADAWPNDWAQNLRVDSGPEDGAPLLLFSGLGVSAFPLRPAAVACTDLPVRIGLQSLPGHTGDVTKFQNMSFAETLAEADAALRAMALGGRQVMLGGFSAGAVLAMCLAARRPELVRSLLLVGYCPRLKGFKRNLVVGACGLLDRFGLTRPLLAKRSFRVKESGTAGLMDPAYHHQPRFDRYSAKAFAVLARLQREAAEAVWAVKMPVHFFHGEHDDRADVQHVLDLHSFLQFRGAPEPRIYELSPHCVTLGPKAKQFQADFASVVGDYL